jgi:integrase
MCFIDRVTGKHKSKILKSKNYSDAVVEGIEFRKRVENGIQETAPDRTRMNIPQAIILFDKYMNGETQYLHLKKQVTKKHRKEVIKYCKLFGLSLKKNHNLKIMKPGDVTNNDVSIFYREIEIKYQPKTFNKVLSSLTSFYKFLIEIEELDIKNPFTNCIRKQVPKGENLVLSKDEFDKIVAAVETKPSLKSKRSNGRRDNMYKPWMVNAFKLFLFIGGRREEVLSLKWSDIMVKENGISFFIYRNLKVERITKKEASAKYIPINDDLMDLLYEMGYEEMKGKDIKLIDPENKYSIYTLMDKVTAAFTHFREAAGIETPYTLKHLRKTYLSWVFHSLGSDTKLLSSHTSLKVLEDHYINPLMLNIDEERLMKVKVFG